MTAQVLKLGIPAGSLQEATGELFRRLVTRSPLPVEAITPASTIPRFSAP